MVTITMVAMVTNEIGTTTWQVATSAGFGYRPMGALTRLQPEELKQAFERMRTAYDGIEQQRNARERTIALPTAIRSVSKAPRLSAG